MPIRSSSNNRVLPSNSRAVDVATRAIHDVLPVQQRRYDNAFQVTGFDAVIYHRLTQGVKCSCQSHDKQVATLLDQDGKLPAGTINTLLTGGLEFTVNAYAASSTLLSDSQRVPSVAPIENVSNALGNSNVDVVDTVDSVGSNGTSRIQDLDDLVNDFDSSGVDLTDVACTECFGTGYVGGYSVLGGWRAVLGTTFANAEHNGFVEVDKRPHAFWATTTTFVVALPRGFVSLDTFTVWNNQDRVTDCAVTIDDIDYSEPLLQALCDGREHRVTIKSLDAEPIRFTHLEIQINLSKIASKIEFPKFNWSSDRKILDSLQSMQINASPAIPHLFRDDVIVESVFNKVFVLTDVTNWNDRHQNMLGWDCNTRVIQPTELLFLLPRRLRGRQHATHMVRDNVGGIRRT